MPASSKAQQRFFGVVKAMQKGDKPKEGEAGKVAKSMKKKDVDKYAKTKHKGLPNKMKREQRVRELIKKMVREELAKMNEGTCGYGENGELGEEPAGPHLIKKKLKEAKETIFDVAKRVMKDKQAYGYKTKKGLVTVDVQTANLLTKVFKKINPKMKKILSDLGYKSPTQLMNTLWAVVK
jgi:hypothetical protein